MINQFDPLAKIKWMQISEIVGEDKMNQIDICGIPLQEMTERELTLVLELVRLIQARRGKKDFEFDQSLIEKISQLVGKEFLYHIRIVTVRIDRMSKEELEVLYKLLQFVRVRIKRYRIRDDFFFYLSDTQRITFRFDYRPTIVQSVQQLSSSKFNRTKKEWSIHLSDWTSLQDIFQSTDLKIDEIYRQWESDNKENRLLITTKGCFLTGESLPLGRLHMATSFPDPNEKHLRETYGPEWDGRIALFEKGSGFFPLGLLDKVLKELRMEGTTFKMIDERVRPEKTHDFEMNVSLRDYQEVTMKKAIENEGGILQLATGAGKTKTASALVSYFGMNTIFFVHTKFLLGQAKEALEEVLGTKIGQVGDGVVDIQPVTVAMIQTTIKALGGDYEPSLDEKDGEVYVENMNLKNKESQIVEMLDKSDVLFFDECQFVAAESFYTIANYCPAYYKFGLSATPYRSDKKDMMIEAALGKVIHRISASYLIDRGFLTKPRIHYFKIPTRYPYGDDRTYMEIYRCDIVENVLRNERIVQSAISLNKKNKSVLILVQQVLHGTLLKKLFAAKGVDVEFVFGDDNLEKREQEVYRLRTKQSLILIATTIADEGLDVPSLDSVILAGGGKSPSKGMQRVGRALRLFGEREQLSDITQSAMEISTKGQNVLILVDHEEMKDKLMDTFSRLREEGHSCKAFTFEGEGLRPATRQVSMDMTVSASSLEETKQWFETSSNVILIARTSSFTADDVNKMKRLSSVLIVGGEQIEIEDIVVDRVFPTFGVVSESEEVSIVESVRNLLSDKTVRDIQKGHPLLFLTESKKIGTALSAIIAEIQESEKKKPYLTGTPAIKRSQKLFQQVAEKKEQIVIVNPKYLDSETPFDAFKAIHVQHTDMRMPKSVKKITQLDVRLFADKKEAYVIDFMDESKYLEEHSRERRRMFETEPSFEISG